MKTYVKYLSLFSLFGLCLLLNACTVVYKSTGKVFTDYTEDEGVPYILANDDVTLVCSMTEAFTPFLLSFSQVNSPPDKLAILFYLMAGNCAEFKAWEEELRYLRAIHKKSPIEAQDARIAQQRLLSLAARRQLIGYHYLVSAFAEPGAECPEFTSDKDELYWLIGLLDGMQAIMNDIASGGSEQVPLNIAAKVGRGATCLDNEKWWGTPDAIQAAIWLIIPGTHSVEKNPLEVMNHSIEIGLEQGISLTQVLAAQVFLGQGALEKVKQIISKHAESNKQTSANQEFKILNEISRLQLRAISDRLWTEATGKRTPLGKIGSFWDDPDKSVDSIDIDEFL